MMASKANIMYIGPLFILVLILQQNLAQAISADPNGYILYCPCMGRFGNQAEQFLGTLTFARALGRTLVLPPWVEYNSFVVKPDLVPFDTYFDVKALHSYHFPVITMEHFMTELAPTVWPVGKRTVFCYSARDGNSGTKGNSCNAKGGSPFGPFWDHFDIDFDSSEFHGPLLFDGHNEHEMKRWREKYPGSKYPVMAFVSTPGPFPAVKDDLGLHRFIKWSADISSKAKTFIDKHLGRPFIGVHMRNGPDWKSACSHVKNSPAMFASYQCTGYRNEHGRLSTEMCFPSDNVVIAQIKQAADDYKAKFVFIGTDYRDLVKELLDALPTKVKIVRHPKPTPHLDLAILAQADYYIGNCVSTFSSFTKRERDVKDLPSGFWSFSREDNISERGTRVEL